MRDTKGYTIRLQHPGVFCMLHCGMLVLKLLRMLHLVLLVRIQLLQVLLVRMVLKLMLYLR